jgi:hypothetical protein
MYIYKYTFVNFSFMKIKRAANMCFSIDMQFLYMWSKFQ